MNKQELLKKYTVWKAALKPYCPNRNRKTEELKSEFLTEFISDLNQLDEQPKVTVPQFVAKWINQCKEKATLADCLDGYYEISNGEVVSSEDFQNWVADNENDELTAKAWVFGYEVEKEPKFIVKVGNLYLIEPLGDTSDSTIRTTWNHKNAYEFTSYDMAQTHANKFGGIVEEVK